MKIKENKGFHLDWDKVASITPNSLMYMDILKSVYFSIRDYDPIPGPLVDGSHHEINYLQYNQWILNESIKYTKKAMKYSKGMLDMFMSKENRTYILVIILALSERSHYLRWEKARLKKLKKNYENKQTT